MTWKAIGDASACSMCCTDKAAGHCQKPSHTNFADHSLFNRWVSTGADFFFSSGLRQALWISLHESVALVDSLQNLCPQGELCTTRSEWEGCRLLVAGSLHRLSNDSPGCLYRKPRYGRRGVAHWLKAYKSNINNLAVGDQVFTVKKIPFSVVFSCSFLFLHYRRSSGLKNMV